MKKGLIVAVVCLSMLGLSVPAAAAGGRHGCHRQTYQSVTYDASVCANGCFVDENGDGVCDYAGTGAGCANGCFVDENGDGVCDYAGTGAGCANGCFVDEDGDGVCDYAGTGAGYGVAAGRGCGWRRSHCGR